MKYEHTSVNDLCDYLIGNCSIIGYSKNYGNFTKFEMFDFIKEKTSNFDNSLFKYLIQDIREYIWKIPINIFEHCYPYKSDYKKELAHSCEPLERYLFLKNINFNIAKNLTLKQSIDKLIDIDLVADVHYPLLHKLIEFSDIAELEYKRVTELIPEETEPILKGIKRPNNTHNVQFALLERLGIIEYLKNEYNLPDTKMSELIANILNKDIQNTRTMLSFTGTKNQESNLPKNQDIVNDVLIKTGAIQKD